MRGLSRLIVAALFLSASAYAQDRRLWILVPNFENSGIRRVDEFGTKTSTFVFLQLWRQLIKRPTPNPEGLDFGKAGVTWDHEALPPRSFEEAEALARLQTEDPILIVWGQMTEWGDSIFIHPRLAIRTDGSAAPVTGAVWKIAVGNGADSEVISVPLPATRYDFSPVQLSTEVISRFSKPEGLELFKEPRANAEKIGEVGEYFTRILQEGNYAKVQVRGLSSPGWVYAPPLSSTPTEFVDFTSGILKVLRRDWRGALANLNRTASVRNAPESVKSDAQLLAALCLSESGNHQAAINLLEGARERPARSLRLDQYLAMAYLSAVLADREHSATYVRALQNLVDVNMSREAPFISWWKQLETLVRTRKTLPSARE